MKFKKRKKHFHNYMMQNSNVENEHTFYNGSKNHLKHKKIMLHHYIFSSIKYLNPTVCNSALRLCNGVM